MSSPRRKRASILALVSTGALTACGGGGGGTSAIPALQNGVTPAVSVSGAVTSIQSSSVFILQTGDGRQLTVTISPSTVIAGPAPYVDESVDVDGTSGATPSTIVASSVKQSSAGITSSSGTIAISGSYVKSTATGFVLKSDAGTSVTVTTDGSTTYANGRPKTGSYLEVSGPGSTTAVTARLVALFASTPPGVTVTGTIKQQTAYGFQLTPASGPAIPIGIVSATSLSGTVSVGQQVTVAGAGASSAAVFASSVTGATAATPAPTASPVPLVSPSPGATPTPTPDPGVSPTAAPLSTPSPVPTLAPTPTPVPTIAPTPVPTVAPTPVPIVAPTATPVPTPAPPSVVPRHVQTATYLTSSTEINTSPSVYAPYLTWAYAKGDHYGVVHASGIKTVLYTNPLMPVSGNPYEYPLITGSYTNVQAKDCSSNPVTTYSGTGYLTDVTNPSAGSFVSTVISDYVNNLNYGNPGYLNPFDLIFVDNANSFYGTSAMPCGYTASTWTANMDAALAAEPYPTLINTLSVAEYNIPAKVAGLQGSNIVGGMYEHCYNDGQWTPEEDGQLQALAEIKSQGKGPGPAFWCYLNGTTVDGSTVIPQRLFAYASFLLTYDPNYSVFQESYASSPSTFKVMPETGFVPLEPASTPASISDLQTAAGAYVQQYAYCYYRGSLVGACEIAVNPGTATVSVPNPKNLLHSVVLSGSGILDGGAVSFNGPQVTSLAPGTAAILVP